GLLLAGDQVRERELRPHVLECCRTGVLTIEHPHQMPAELRLDRLAPRSRRECEDAIRERSPVRPGELVTRHGNRARERERLTERRRLPGCGGLGDDDFWTQCGEVLAVGRTGGPVAEPHAPP